MKLQAEQQTIRIANYTGHRSEEPAVYPNSKEKSEHILEEEKKPT